MLMFALFLAFGWPYSDHDHAYANCISAICTHRTPPSLHVATTMWNVSNALPWNFPPDFLQRASGIGKGHRFTFQISQGSCTLFSRLVSSWICICSIVASCIMWGRLASLFPLLAWDRYVSPCAGPLHICNAVFQFCFEFPVLCIYSGPAVSSSASYDDNNCWHQSWDFVSMSRTTINCSPILSFLVGTVLYPAKFIILNLWHVNTCKWHCFRPSTT